MTQYSCLNLTVMEWILYKSWHRLIPKFTKRLLYDQQCGSFFWDIVWTADQERNGNGITLLYSRNYHTIVNQLYLNKTFKNEKREMDTSETVKGRGNGEKVGSRPWPVAVMWERRYQALQAKNSQKWLKNHDWSWPSAPLEPTCWDRDGARGQSGGTYPITPG